MKNNNKFRAHGANPDKIYAAMGLDMPRNVTILDFSTNANVMPWPELLKLDILDIYNLASHYPDDDCLELRELIAERENLSPDNILIVNGTNEAFYILAAIYALKGGTAGILQPSYSEYARALKAFGTKTLEVCEFYADGKSAMLNGAFDLAIFSNPCNPTGKYRRDCLELAQACPKTVFAIDEAYIDFLLTQEPVKLDVLKQPNIIILRSLTKIYHLSGVRIGYILANREQIARLKACQPTWSVNAIAQKLALAFLHNEKFLTDSRAFYASETPRFIRSIEQTGFHVRPTDVHYFLMDINIPVMPGQEHGQDYKIIKELLQRGIVVRHTRNFSGLDGRCVRISTRSPSENDRLCEALIELAKL